MPSYKPKEEIDDIQRKSDEKISNAKKLHQQIAALLKDPAFLTKDEQNYHIKLIEFHNNFLAQQTTTL